MAKARDVMKSIDRFSFPQETTFRFYALIAALLGAFSFMWSWLYLALPHTRLIMKSTFSVCLRSALALGHMAEAQGCIHRFNRHEANFVLGCLAATALAVLVVHLVNSWVKIRFGRLRALVEVADPELLPPISAALEALVAQAGVSPPPVFLVRPRPESEAFTFGFWRKYYICMNSALVSEFFTRRDVFDAKIRHELAHFRNRDINKTGITMVSWWIFAATGLAVVVYCLLQQPNMKADLAALLGRQVVIVAIVYLATKAVIRARELYADSRAFLWDGPSGALMATLQRRALRDADAPERHPLLRILQWHPTAKQRLEALRHPAQPVRTDFLLPVLIGLAFGIGHPPLGFVLTMLTEAHDATIGNAISICLFIVPLAGLAGAVIWRSTSRSYERGLTDISAILLGVSAAIGIIAGYRISFMGALMSSDVFEHPGLVLSVILLAGFCLWVRAGAYWWLQSGFAQRTIMIACWGGIALGTFILATAWLELSIVHDLRQGLTATAIQGPMLMRVMGLFFSAIVQHRTTFLLFACLWLYLAIPVWWGIAPAVRAQLLRRRALRLLRWVSVYVALLVLERLVIRALFDPALRETEEFKIWMFQFFVLTAVLLQAILSISLTVRRPVATLGEACLCTMIAGVLMSAAFLLVNLAFGGSIDVSFAWVVTASIANQGAAAALCIGTLGAGLRYAFAGFRPLPPADGRAASFA